MDKLSVRRGASLPISLKLDESNALTAELIVKKSVTDVAPTFTVVSNVVAKVADLTITATNSDITPGDYLYQVTITYTDGNIEKYPETQDCDDDEVDFPILTIQPSLD